MDNHHRAMELADKADQANRTGQFEEAMKYFKQAFYLERETALNCQLEPTRSILFRSAASLAIECNRLDEAKKMIAYGLSGSPPVEIEEELRHLRDLIKFVEKI